LFYALRQRDYAALEREIASVDYQEVLGDLQQGHLFLRRFGSWTEVVRFMRAGTSHDPVKDGVLLPILVRHSEDRDRRWMTVLLTVCWPGLLTIHRRIGHWDKDADDRWCRITWAFLQTVMGLNTEQRSERFVQRIYGETYKRTHRDYEKEWNWERPLRSLDPRPKDATIPWWHNPDGDDHFRREPGESDWGMALWEITDELDLEIARLRAHHEAGRLSEADFYLLVGTTVYKQSLAEYVEEHGLDYEATKKRRQRAQAVIRQADEESS
jgi:hypothetical protein